MPKPLEIKVRLDRSQAAKAAKEHIEDARKMAAAAKAAAKEEEKAYSDAWKAVEKASKDQLKSLAADAKKIAETQKAAAKEYSQAIADAMKAAAETSKAVMKGLEADEKETRKRIAADAIQRARDSAKAIADAQRGAAKATAELEIAESRKALTNDQVIVAARQSLAASDTQKRIDGARKVMEKFRLAAASQKEGNSEIVGGMRSVGSAVVGLASTYATLGTAVRIISVISEMWKDQRKDIEAAADALHRQREDALAIAALKGNQGQSTQETADQLSFRAKTLQTRQGALALQEGILNTGNASANAGFIAKPDLDRLMVRAGQYQATNPKYTPDAVGNLMGILPTMIKTQGQSPDDVFRRGVGIAKTFEMGSSNPGPALGQFMKNSGLIGPGMYRSPEELSAVQSAFSSISPDESGTLAEQFLRGTVTALNKQPDYVKGELKATNQMSAVQIGRLIAADLKKQEVDAKAAGKEFNPYDYLYNKGYHFQETAKANISFANMINSGSYDKTFAKRSTPESAPTMNEAMKPILEFQAVDPVANARRTEIARDATAAIKALGPEEKYLEAKRQAFERLKSAGKTYGTFEASNDSPLWKGMIVDEVQRDITERAKAAGVPIPKLSEAAGFRGMAHRSEQALNFLNPFAGSTFGEGTGPLGGSPGSRALFSEADRARSYFDLDSQILAKGGPATNNDGQIKTLEEIARTLKVIEQQGRNAVPAFQQAPPPVRQPGVGQRGQPPRP